MSNSILNILNCLNNKQDTKCHYGLLNGLIGELLFLEQCSKTNSTSMIIAKYNGNLLDSINNSKPDPSFCTGYSGLLFGIPAISCEVEANTLESIKKYIINTSKVDLIKNHFDYLHGYLGTTLSFLDSNNEHVNNCIKQLYTTKITTNTGSYYWESKMSDQETDVDFGLAHGLTSIISVLSKFIEKKIAVEMCTDLVIGSIQFLNENKLKDQLSKYGYSIRNNISSRLSWCYGDLGVARTFWLAGVACNREDWKQEAVEIMLHTAKRKKLEENGVVDAGICHGTSGIAHIFNRFYRDTGMQEFKNATDYWIEQTLLMSKFEDGLAGYKSWQGPEQGWTNEYGLLEGIAGIGLVLHSYLHPEIEPTWDRCLLLS